MTQELWPQQIWTCQSSACGLRFPVRKDEPRAESCPLCDGQTQFVEEFQRPAAVAPRGGDRPSQPLFTVALDNIRSANNVGSILRTADAVGVSVILGGFTATPENPKVAKTSLGAHEAIEWTQELDLLNAIERQQELGSTIWALETTTTSVDISQAVMPDGPLIVVVGNEVSGIDPAILRIADQHVHLPMAGIKTSLNVAVAMGAAAYLVQRGPICDHQSNG